MMNMNLRHGVKNSVKVEKLGYREKLGRFKSRFKLTKWGKKTHQYVKNAKKYTALVRYRSSRVFPVLDTLQYQTCLR